MRTLALITLLSATTTHAQIQRLVDHTLITEPEIGGCVVSQDQSSITMTYSQDAFMLMKFDASGAPVWSRELVHPGIGGHLSTDKCATLSDDNGGAHVMALLPGSSEPFDDTLRYVLIYDHVDADGELAGSWTVERMEVVPQGPLFMLNSVRFTLDHEGHIIAVMNIRVDNYDRTEVIKFTGDGDVVWARAFPALSGSFDHADQIVSGPNGDVYVLKGITGPDGLGRDPINLAAISASGEALWDVSHAYTNAISHANSTGIAVDGNGNLQVSGYLMTANNYYTLPLLNTQGQLLEVDLYEAPHTGMALPEVHIASNGDRLLHGLYLLRMDTIGSPAYAQKPLIVPGDGEDLSLRRRAWDLSGERIGIASNFMRQEEGTGFQRFQSAVELFDLDNLAACMHDDRSGDFLAFPLEYMSTTVNPAALSDITALVSPVSTPPTEVNALPLYGMVDVCTLVTGMNDPAAFQGPLVRTTLLTSGMPITITEGPFVRIDVVDGRGRVLVQGAVLDGSRTLSTQGWPAGAYAVRAFDAQGSVRAVQKIMVE